MDPLLLTTNEMAEIDNRAINEFGVPGVCLMENAGVGVVRAMQNRYGNFGEVVQKVIIRLLLKSVKTQSL